VYRRDPPGTGRFDLVPSSSSFSEVTGASYDAGADELVVPTSDFSAFVFVSDSNPLPVELASFEGSVAEKRGDDVARLRWETAAETGNTRFDVQRRIAETSGWTTVGHREGAGTTSQPQSYTFVDTSLPYEADALEYRLRQVDTDGTPHTTDPIRLVRGGPTDLTLLGTAPNPTRSQTTVRYAIPEDGAAAATDGPVLRLYDMLGRQVRSTQLRSEAGRHERVLDVQSLPSGVYFLRLRSDGESVTRKLTIVQ
jgi:hypothetical protein